MKGREGGGEGETTRTGGEISKRTACEIQSRCRSGPASGYNQKSYSVSGFRLPVCKARTSLPDFGDRRSSSKQSPPLLRARGRIRGRGVSGARGAGGPGGGGRAAGRSAPPSRAASGAEPGRQADKAPPAPSPTAAHREGGGRRAGGMWEEEEEGEEGRCSRRDWAGSRRGGWGGGGAGRPRRTGRREGFLKPKINKLFLFTCGVGGGGEGGERALWPLLFPSP